MLQNPGYGVISFDSIFYSLLMIFNIVSLEGWTYIMYCIFNSVSLFTFPFFVFIVFVGAFFLVNLTLAVIKAKFSDSENKNKEDDDEKMIFDQPDEEEL